MVTQFWQILLITVGLISVAEALEPGDLVPDFVMPATNGAPQRLSEQIGHPIMLVWLNDCDACEEEQIAWQYLAESLSVEGLVAWFVWREEKGDRPPKLRLPVLKYEASNNQAWWFEPSPAVMFIAPGGRLDHLYIDNVDARRTEIADELKQWLHNKNWFQ